MLVHCGKQPYPLYSYSNNVAVRQTCVQSYKHYNKHRQQKTVSRGFLQAEKTIPGGFFPAEKTLSRRFLLAEVKTETSHTRTTRVALM